MQGVPWPWPLAPLVLLTTIGLAAIVLRLVHTHVVLGGEDQARRARAGPRDRVPLLPTFRTEILPALPEAARRSFIARMTVPAA